jgi:hypothetical protein
VEVERERKSATDIIDKIEILFHVSDMSIRGMIIDHAGEHGGYKRQLEEGQDPLRSQPFLTPYRDPIADWPVFPLQASVEGGRPTKQQVQAVRGKVGSLNTDTLDVVMGNSPRNDQDMTSQARQRWAAGYPWWVSNDRNGFKKCKLIETSIHGKIDWPESQPSAGHPVGAPATGAP